MAAWRLKIIQRRQHFSLLLTMVLFAAPFLCHNAEGRRAHKRFIIHIPYKIKTHHHTHTVYSHIQSGGGKKQTIYKILGYSQQHHHHHGHMHKGYKDEKYMHGCDDHKSDMVFNQYNRNDEEQYYPDVEDEFIEDEQGDEWERARMFY